METLATPNLTAMQLIVGAVSGVIVAGIAVAQAFGAGLTVEQSAAILGLWAALGGVLVLADAIIRNGRSRAFTNYPKGMVAAAEPHDPAVRYDSPDTAATTYSPGPRPGA